MTRRRVLWLGILSIVGAIALVACGGGAANQPGADSSLETTLQAVQQATPPPLPTAPKLTPLAGAYGLPTRSPATEEVTEEAVEEATAEPTEEASSGEAVPFEASGDAADAIQQAYAQARALEPDQSFEVTFTDAQLEAAVNARLAESGASELIQDLSIAFIPDEIDVAFSVMLGETGILIDVTMALSVSVDDGGEVQVEVLSAEAGQAEIPPEILDTLNEALANALVGASGVDAADEVDLTITDIVIGEGIATVSGTVEPAG
jgi:hypothetical protein